MKKLTRPVKRVGLIIAVELFLAVAVVYLFRRNFQVLNPKGLIASQQRRLIIFAASLSLIVVVPVYVMTFFIAWKYRASNHKAIYQPDWDHSRKIEATWWGVPTLLILILSIVTWNSSHSLDPFRPIA